MGLSEGPNQYNYADQNGQNMIDPEGKVIVLIPIIIWAWRIYEVYDLYAQVRDGCFDMKQFLIDRIPVGKLFKHIKWKRKPGPKPKEPPRCPLPGSNSFTGETVVHIWDEATQVATTKPIKDIRLGDKVLAYAEWATANDTDAEGSPLPALRIEPVSDIYSSHKQQTLVTLTLDNGETIHATAGHPFKTAAGWRDATLLNVGTQIVSKDGVGEGSARNADGKPGLFANAVNRTKQAIAGTVASLATAAVMAVSPVAEVGTAALAQNQIQEQVQQQTPALVRGLADIETERYRTVVAFTKQTTVVPVYNLEVASAHTFFVGEEGVLVHNFMGPGGGRGGKPPAPRMPKCGPDDDCATQWATAYEYCAQALGTSADDFGVTGAKSIQECARGLVPARCGGIPIQPPQKRKPKRYGPF